MGSGKAGRDKSTIIDAPIVFRVLHVSAVLTCWKLLRSVVYKRSISRWRADPMLIFGDGVIKQYSR